MSIVEKLKHMIASRGGDPKGVMTIADGVDRLEKTDADSGSQVPIESDICCVVFRIHGHIEEPPDDVLVLDEEITDQNINKTPSEVISAAQDGKYTVLVVQLLNEDDEIIQMSHTSNYDYIRYSSDRYEVRWFDLPFFSNAVLSAYSSSTSWVLDTDVV